jgi:hypothetical protein
MLSLRDLDMLPASADVLSILVETHLVFSQGAAMGKKPVLCHRMTTDTIVVWNTDMLQTKAIGLV